EADNQIDGVTIIKDAVVTADAVFIGEPEIKILVQFGTETKAQGAVGVAIRRCGTEVDQIVTFHRNTARAPGQHCEGVECNVSGVPESP
ncbi:MAG: hypothetical protein ACO38X_14285, partial [bacterium]